MENLEIVSARPEDADFIAWVVAQGMHMDKVPSWAILIDQGQSDFVEKAKATLPTDKTIAIYCRSGRRSANTAGRLADVGYKCVNLKGGIIAWQGANMPVTKE